MKSPSHEHFLPNWFRRYTLLVILFVLGLGVVTAISGLWNFLLLGVGEPAVRHLSAKVATASE